MPKKKHISIFVDEDLHKWFKVQAALSGRCMSELIRDALFFYKEDLEEEEKEEE